jgi:hypothetical protein
MKRLVCTLRNDWRKTKDDYCALGPSEHSKLDMLCWSRDDLVAQQSDRIYIGSHLGEEAANERGLAETVDDTQGIEVGETRRSAIMNLRFVFDYLCLFTAIQIHSMKRYDTMLELSFA